MLNAGAGLAFLGAAALLLLFGLAMCLWAAYLWLAVSLGPSAAAALIGLVSMMLAGGVAWIAIHLNR